MNQSEMQGFVPKVLAAAAYEGQFDPIIQWVQRSEDQEIREQYKGQITYLPSCKSHDLSEAKMADWGRFILAHHSCWAEDQAKAAGQAASATGATQEPSEPPRIAPAQPASEPMAVSPMVAAPNAPKSADPGRCLEFEDDVLGGMVLEFLRLHRAEAYTYNQVAAELDAGWKQTSKILRRLAERGSDIVAFEVKGAGEKKVGVYKFAPERKALDRNYAKAQEIVGAVIVKFLTAKPHQGYRAVCVAMRRYFGYIDDHTVGATLAALVESGRIVCNPGPRRAKLHSIAEPLD